MTYPINQNKNCMLIVDDDMLNRELLKNIFADLCSFEEAENGKIGLEKVDRYRERLCAILLDVNMPVMDGMALLRVLHDRGVTAVVPVFLITASEEMELAAEAYQLGVMDVITKPVTPFIIYRRVISVVELFEARESLRQTVQQQEKQLQENVDTIDALHRGTIEVLASAIEFRDMESGEHTNRIYAITKHILTHTRMGEGLTPGEIEDIAIGSIMHDIGKIAVSDVILNKPGRLTAEEFETMKTHTVKGAILMEQLNEMQSHPAYGYACDIARHHHERWDGRGYPDGLKGDEISIPSQVVSIADVYDALVSPRVYKRAFSPDRAVEMIRDGQCGVFNPLLLSCFFEVEPIIRTWYGEDGGKQPDAVDPQVRAVAAEIGQPSKELVDVLLLTAAVKTAFDMIICVNLTQNSYYMMDYDRFQTHCAGGEGVFDDLIVAGASSVPAPHDTVFAQTFSRASLLAAYARGERMVRLEHPQRTDDGRVVLVSTKVLFMEDPRNGDLRQITLSHYLGEYQSKEEPTV